MSEWTRSPAGPPAGLAMAGLITDPIGASMATPSPYGCQVHGRLRVLVKSFNAVLKYISYDNLT